jgi:transposase-like protein
MPFLQLPPEVRKVIYTTIPNEQAALKVLYLVIRDKFANGRPRITGKINGWKTALNTLAVIYGERITTS